MTDYIRFYESVAPTKRVHCFPNNKGWINREIKALLNRTKTAFMAGDSEKAQKEIQREPKKELRRAKDYRLEGRLRENNPREVWTGLRNTPSLKRKGRVVEGTKATDKLNLFFIF